MIRKIVVETIASYEVTELTAANEIDQLNLVDLIFETTRDESSAIRKQALQII